MAISFSVSFDDPGGAYSGYYSLLISNAKAAGQRWADHFVGNASIQIKIAFDPAISTANARSIANETAGKLGDFTIVESGAAREIRTGSDPNAGTADIRINIGQSYLVNELWLDPSPTDRSAPGPEGKTDAVSVLIHEIGHALGIIGYRETTTGHLSEFFKSKFDTHLIEQDDIWHFNGSNAVAVYGGPVPLTYGNLYHYGNAFGLPGSDLVPNGLMNGVVYNQGFLYDISPLDIAFMKDLGLPVNKYVGYRGNDVITAGSGNDLLNGLEGNDTLSGGNGNDTLLGGAGKDTLKGGAGKDVLKGLKGADVLSGGTGEDRFDFDAVGDSATSTTRDTISDFKKGEDKIDLSTIDANGSGAGNIAFKFVSAFSNNATGQLRFDAAKHLLLGSTDSDSAAEFSILLTGINSMTGSNFIP